MRGVKRKLLTNLDSKPYNSKRLKKDYDEDSSYFLKGKANSGWWEPDASKRIVNITSELPAERVPVSAGRFFSVNRRAYHS